MSEGGYEGGGGGGGGGSDCQPLGASNNHQREPINLKSNEAESERERSPELSGQHQPPRPPSSAGGGSPHQQHQHQRNSTASHINGTMASMFQNLQNLASMQQSMPQMSQLTQQAMTQLASNLQNGPPMVNSHNHVVNSPLNLSVTNPGLTSPNPASNPGAGGGMMPPNMQSSMPQLILASGQLVQGIQGAQLLIPTSQGVATQTILTIPVNNMTANDQMVNMALSNGQVASTLANLQAMTPQNRSSNLMNSALTNALLNQSMPNFMSNGSAHELLQALQQPSVHQHQQQNNSLLQTVPQGMHGRRSSSPRIERHMKEREREYSSPYSRERERDNSSTNSGHSMAAAAAALTSINRLAATNGEITITTAHNAGSAGCGSGVTSPHHTIKMSPGSMKMSPSDHDDHDLLADSPNQPTINQTQGNMVDGINLDDIKEFAKAFKLRRLGLGLTQTQVGQALSVTEGPAYSQSAICSALASQMLAAQLSSQQQNIFEKLDITPKSAQKIKPVLERWMQEAEERYASGQNHLTDFIGMEPSKKRKRRTSFTPQALELLNAHFERNTHPSGTEITGLAHQLGYEREVIRIWFCNKRQALKNTVRMMSKGMV